MLSEPNEESKRWEDPPQLRRGQCYSPASHNHGQSNSKPIIISQEDSFWGSGDLLPYDQRLRKLF